MYRFEQTVNAGTGRAPKRTWGPLVLLGALSTASAGGCAASPDAPFDDSAMGDALGDEAFEGESHEADLGEPKGYFHSIVDPPAVNDVCVQIIPAGSDWDTMPFEWTLAFWIAAADWNSTDVNMRMTHFWDWTCGQVISVGFGDHVSDPKLRAEADFPDGSGFPGAFIEINRDYYGPTCNPFVPTGTINDFPLTEKIRTATHELGHALGFHHPQTTTLGFIGSIAGHVPGTQAVTSTQDIEQTYNYPSVMHAPPSWLRDQGGTLCVGDKNGAITQGLSADDRLSANRVF